MSGKKKSRFGPVAETSVAIIVILSMEIAGIVILMSVTTGSVAAPIIDVGIFAPQDHYINSNAISHTSL